MHKLHRDRLASIKPSVDCNTPSTVNMKHLTHRLKKKQLADDRQQEIALENRKLMEKMAKILRGQAKPMPGAESNGQPQGPHAPPPFSLGKSKNEPVRRKMREKIELENMQMAQRLADTTPHYDHHGMADEYSQSVLYMKNISRAHQREQRLARALGRAGGGYGADGDLAELSASQSADLAGLGPDGAGLPQVYANLMAGGGAASTGKIAVRTARQVRDDVAAQRGPALPPMLVSSAVTAGGQSPPFAHGASHGNGRIKMQMDHLGAGQSAGLYG